MLTRKEILGTSLAFITALISGVSIFANKIFIVNIDQTVFTALRAIIIGLVFLILSFYFNSWKRKENNKMRWGYLLFIGIIGGGLAFLLFFSGLKLTTSGHAAILNKTLPLYVILIAWLFLKEKITSKQILAFLLMMAGTIIILSNTIPITSLWTNPKLGDLLVITATILWAIEYSVAKKTMNLGEHNFVVSFARMFFGAVFLFGVMLFTNKFSLIATLTATQWTNILISTALLFCYILTFYWAIRYINLSKASIILLVSPIITTILGAIFLKEPITYIGIIAAILILIGAYLVAKTNSEQVEI